MVDCNRVEGVCGGREVLPIGLLMRLGLDCGQSCKQVSALLPQVSHCLFTIHCDLLLSFPTTCHCTTKAPDTFYSPIWPYTAPR